MRRAGATGLAAALLLFLALAPAPARAGGLAGYVEPFAGTQLGPGTYGSGHNFPGATVPFGMVQWSPDTTPADMGGVGGYDHRDTHLRGFSLTHLSGAGCKLYGDFPFVPTTERLQASPAKPGSGALDGKFEPGFSHANERARPGYYSVRLNPAHGGSIETELTASTRTGLGRFTFPSNPHSSILINAGGSAQPDDLASVQIDPARHEIDGVASSGLFCGQRPRYKVYVAAVFSRPFAAYGTWAGSRLSPGSTTASESRKPAVHPPSTAQAGAYATFDTTRNARVLVRVGVSFVSVEDARANLAAEDPGLAFGTIAGRAQHRWNQSLGRIRVRGGATADLRTFYTAVYHVFIAPRTFSDVNGDYIGMDDLLHRARGRVQYADLSGWDIYRTEIQLLSILAPTRASDLVRSMLADTEQSGCLPRWPYANGQSMTMVGDSADPIIASAAAFGAGAFDQGAALEAMVRGASEPCQSANGEYLERQGLAEYQALGYIPFDVDTTTNNADSIYGSPDDVWGSAATSLEYDLDDFAIAQFAARSAGAHATYAEFMQRSAAWRRLLDPSTGLIEPRYANGAFPAPYDPLKCAGFVEGDSYQYTWMVPQDPSGLIRKLGGRAKSAARLDHFLRQLNGGIGGTRTDHALLGNEPSLATPWLYDWMRRPYRTQAQVRRALLSLYDTSPDGYPGNDDLGTLSAWYVFGALGLYPEVPGVGLLAIGSPLFGSATLSLPHGKRTTITGTAYAFKKGSSANNGKAGGTGKRVKVPLSPAVAPYVRSLTFNGHPYGKPWTTYCALARGAHLSFQLGPQPDPAWGSSAAAVPPSFGPHRPMPKSACAP